MDLVLLTDIKVLSDHVYDLLHVAEATSHHFYLEGLGQVVGSDVKQGDQGFVGGHLQPHHHVVVESVVGELALLAPDLVVVEAVEHLRDDGLVVPVVVVQGDVAGVLECLPSDGLPLPHTHLVVFVQVLVHAVEHK